MFQGFFSNIIRASVNEGSELIELQCGRIGQPNGCADVSDLGHFEQGYCVLLL